MQYRWTHSIGPERQQWLLKRNCAMKPRQLAACFGVLAMVSLAIATVFAMNGAWLVVPFACLEMGALAVAFVVYARHAADYERIVVGPGSLVVEQSHGAVFDRIECQPAWIRVEYQGSHGELIRLVAGGSEVAVGRFVPGESRGDLALELRRSIAGWHS